MKTCTPKQKALAAIEAALKYAREYRAFMKGAGSKPKYLGKFYPQKGFIETEDLIGLIVWLVFTVCCSGCFLYALNY